MGTAVILVIHVFLAVAIVALVLLQRGKGADAGAGFGAGASGTVFGARGSATVLSKATAVLATLFFVTSLSLAYLSGNDERGPSSLLERARDAAEKTGAQEPGPLTAPQAPAGTEPLTPDAPVEQPAPAPGNDQTP